jgi:hypothetical protein
MADKIYIDGSRFYSSRLRATEQLLAYKNFYDRDMHGGLG